MGILDTQSTRLTNRKLGRRRLEQKRSARQGEAPDLDRRRPLRGAAAPSRQDATVDVAGRLRRRRNARVVATLGTAGRLLLVILLLPLQVVFVLARPRDLARRLRETPSRIVATSRRFRAASRDPESGAGRVRETLRLSTFFFREELADMQDGFPRPGEVASAVIEAGRRLAARLGQVMGILPRDAHDDVPNRLFNAASMALIASSIGIGLFVAGYQGFEALKGSGRLAIREVRLSGLDRTDEVALAASLGVSVGDNLFDTDPAALVAAAASFPWVDEVAVTRDLRDGLLEIRVREHQPAMLLVEDGIHLVDEKAAVFKPLQAGDPADLPVLTLGEGLDSDGRDRATSGALDLLRALASGRVLTAADVSEIRYEAHGGFTLVTRSGLPVRLGSRDFALGLGRLERAVQTGHLPLDAVASVDAGLRDRLVAMPLATGRARRQLRERLQAQPVDADGRERMLHLDRIRRSRPDEGASL